MRKLILIAIPLAIVFFMHPFRRPNGVLGIDGSYLRNGHYAIVQEHSSGNTLFFGSLDGGKASAISTYGEFGNPYVTPDGKILVVEGVRDAPLNYRLLEIDMKGPTLTCRRLAESKKYIDSPVAISGPMGGEIIFFTGDFNAQAVGAPVSVYRLARLMGGQVTLFDGPAFFIAGQLNQIAGNRFVAYAAKILAEETTPTTMPEGVSPVDIRLSNGKVEARPLLVLGESIKRLSKVTTQMETEEIFLISTENYNPPNYFIDIIDYSSGSRRKSLPLPAGRYYSRLFPEYNSGETKLLILSVDAEGERLNDKFTVSGITGETVIDTKEVQLSAGSTYDADNCSGPGVTF